MKRESPLEVMASQVFGDESTEDVIIARDWLNGLKQNAPEQIIDMEVQISRQSGESIARGVINGLRELLRR